MPRAVDPIELSIFQQQLIGTWTNQILPGTGKGDETSPYSYNVMVLPQDSPQSPTQDLGYILKNFTYYEKIRFNGPGPEFITVPGTAPNRGGDYQQTPYALFYDQQVEFAQGPDSGKIVHLENGAWLHLQTEKQPIGPYGPELEPGEPKPQDPKMTIAKQISIPHGVSVLALGSFTEIPVSGAPTIPASPDVQPKGLDPAPYTQTLNTPDNYQNPEPNLTNDIHAPLRDAVNDLAAAGTPVNKFIYCQVDTKNGGGVLNIPFETRKAELESYSAQYWLLSIDEGKNYDILAYTQTIALNIKIKEDKVHTFLRPTTNVVTRM